jgi:hypothetical protein
MSDDERRDRETDTSKGSPPFGGSPRRDDPGRAPVDAAFASLEKGIGGLFKVAGAAVGSLKRELDKTQVTKDLERAIGDAGREVVRATTNVASFLGHELTEWSKKVESSVASDDRSATSGTHASDEPRSATPGAPGDDAWPKTREDYERRYGHVEGDWPRSAEEYERRFGRKPKQSAPNDDDPGFTILGG